MKMNTDSIVNRKAMKANMLFLILGFMLAANAARAQWTVIDPSNLTQGIINSTNEMVNTSATAENMLQNFQETVKIYQQAKAYYDKLQAVSDPVRSARKIQKCILLVGEISGIYVNNYEKMLAERLYEMVHEINSPLTGIVDPKKLDHFLTTPSDYGKPWYGQLMAGPQMLAYLLQVGYWIQTYSISL